MTIFKVYAAMIEVADLKDAENVLCEQNYNEGTFYTDREEAETAYEKLAANLAAPRKMHYVVTTYRVDGVLLERGDNCNSIEECDGDIAEAYGTASMWEIEKLAIGKDEE